MSYLGIDLGGTKVRCALFDEQANILRKETRFVHDRAGSEVACLITDFIQESLQSDSHKIDAVGVSVPGIYRRQTGTVWAPNISGWHDYPLLEALAEVCAGIPVAIDSDRACYILGELWQGNARGCQHAIYLSVGTGIGAGICIDGTVLRGAHDIAGAIGWMALDRPFSDEFADCGCFETFASGEGIVKLLKKYLGQNAGYTGPLRNTSDMSAHDVFQAYERGDPLAVKVLLHCVELWGMAAANLVSLFNPEKVIFGGGVFGPAVQFIPQIKEEAAKWAQPVSMKLVDFEESALDVDAGIYGAAFLAQQLILEN